MKLQEVIDCLNEVVADQAMGLDDEAVVCVRPDASDYSNTTFEYDFDIYVAFEHGKRLLVFDSNQEDLSLMRVEEEANLVAEHAKLDEAWTFRAEKAEQTNECWLHWAEKTSEPQKALCNITWLMGNLKRCPDKAKAKDLLAAITGAHPNTIRTSKTIVE